MLAVFSNYRVVIFLLAEKTAKDVAFLLYFPFKAILTQASFNRLNAKKSGGFFIGISCAALELLFKNKVWEYFFGFGEKAWAECHLENNLIRPAIWVFV